MLARIRSFFRTLVRRARVDGELDAEMRFHIDKRTEDFMRAGLSREEARRRARLEFGAVDKAKEEWREARGVRFFDSLAQDLRFGLRMLRKSPGFTAVAVVTLALGIGANTAIFTVIDAALLRPLPYADPQRLVTWEDNESQLDIDDIRAQASFFSAGGGVNPETITYTGGEEPIAIHAGYIDCGLFNVLGVPAELGRTFSAQECVTGGPRAVVVSNSFWREYLGSDSGVLGKAIMLNENSYQVIGVMPASFTVPENTLDLFVPLRVIYPEAAAYRGVHFMRSYWRLKPSVTLAQAAAGMATIDARIAAADPAEEKGRHTIPVRLQQAITGDVRPALLVLYGAVCIVLLIACANFAGLLIARGVMRGHEMTIRAALGGSQRRLIRQSLTESILLVLLGDALGLPLAAFGVEAFVASKPEALAHVGNVSMNSLVILFGIGVSLATGILSGLIPAWNSSRSDAARVMGQNTRTSTSGPGAHRFRKVLVIGEMALALVLLVATGLLIKSFSHLRSVDPGFDPAGVVSFYVQLPENRYHDILKQTQYRRELLDRLDAIPGAESAMIGDVPFDGSELTHSLAIEGSVVSIGEEPDVDTFCVMGDYFRTMRIPIRAGRGLTAMDRENQPLAAVINEALARKYFAGRNPVGNRIRWARETGDPRWMTIVGVAADVKQYSLAEPGYPAVFTPFAQSNEDWRRWMYVVVRIPGASAGEIARIKSQIWSLDAQIPLNRVQTMEDLMGLSLAERRFNMSLLGLFAGLAMILVAVGIYGVISYGVSQRTREIGIRIAVGADRRDVLGLFLGQGARMAAIGLAAGMIGAFALTRLMSTLLFDVAPTDPGTFVLVALIMMAVALIASLVPAWRALRIDPLVALRHE